MREFKFFQKKPERAFTNWMDQMDDYHLGGITPAITENNLINEGFDAHRSGFSPGQCPYDIGTRERELWLRGWSNREDYTSIDETYPEYYNTDEFIFYDVSEIKYNPENQQHYKVMLFRSIEEGYTIEGNRILPGHPMWRFPDVM